MVEQAEQIASVISSLSHTVQLAAIVTSFHISGSLADREVTLYSSHYNLRCQSYFIKLEAAMTRKYATSDFVIPYNGVTK